MCTGCKRNVITRNLFGIMQKLYTFTEGSTKRHGLFKEIQMKCYASQGEVNQNVFGEI